jgi:N-acetylglucosaminyl-diphospho-decaprenol L-rhamnosyltransferase
MKRSPERSLASAAMRSESSLGGAPGSSPQVAVAVISWNTRDLLRRCLASLEPDVRSGFARVRVVDNASTDGSPEMVRAEFTWAEVIEPDENLGFGRAANLGLGEGDEPWVVPSNADVEFVNGALRRLVAASREEPDAGLVAPRLVMPDGRTQHSVHCFPSLRLGLAVHLGLVTIVPGLGDRLCIDGRWNPDRRRQVDWAHGAVLLARREAFEVVGGFDVRQWMYAEDIDLAWRMKGAGWATRYEPEAVVRHEVSAATTKAFADQRLERHLEASFDWMARRRGLGVARTYAAINWLGSSVRALALAPLALLRAGRFAASRERYRRFATAHRETLRRRQARDEAASATVPRR